MTAPPVTIEDKKFYRFNELQIKIGFALENKTTFLKLSKDPVFMESLNRYTENMVREARYSPFISFLEKCYCVFYAITPPKCRFCSCDCNFERFSRGYGRYCSLKCKGKDTELKEKIRNEYIEKYGIGFPPQAHKRYQEMLENGEIDWEKVNKKRKETSMKKYGVSHPKKNKKVQEKFVSTMLERYGVENPLQIDEIKQDIMERNGGLMVKSPSDAFKLRLHPNGKIWYQGKLEKKFIDFWIQNNPDESISKCKRGLPYILGGKKHLYTPDFVVCHPDMQHQLIEIKGQHRYFQVDLHLFLEAKLLTLLRFSPSQWFKKPLFIFNKIDSEHTYSLSSESDIRKLCNELKTRFPLPTKSNKKG